MANNCLVTKLKSVVDNDNLDVLGQVKMRVKNFTGKSIQWNGSKITADLEFKDYLNNTHPAMQYINNSEITSITGTGTETTLYAEDWGIAKINLRTAWVYNKDIEKLFSKLPYLQSLGYILLNITDSEQINFNTKYFAGHSFSNVGLLMNSTQLFNITGDKVDVGVLQGGAEFVFLAQNKIRVNLDIQNVVRYSGSFQASVHGNIAKLPYSPYNSAFVSAGDSLNGEIADMITNWRTFSGSGKVQLNRTIWSSADVTWNGTSLPTYVTSQELNPENDLYINWDANSFSVTAS